MEDISNSDFLNIVSPTKFFHSPDVKIREEKSITHMNFFCVWSYKGEYMEANTKQFDTIPFNVKQSALFMYHYLNELKNVK